MKRDGANRNDLKWIRNLNFEVLNHNKINDDVLLNLSLFKESNVNNEFNFNCLKGHLEHSPKLFLRPDSYYIDDDRKIIVGYEHFNITSTHEGSKGDKANRLLGQIKGKEIPTYEIIRDVPVFTDGHFSGVKSGTFIIPDKEKLKGVIKLPWWIEGDVTHRSGLNIFEDDVVFPKFSYISKNNIAKSITNISNKHIKKYEMYIDNLKKLNHTYNIKFNFVLDMSNLVIPSIKVLASDNDYIRFNNLVHDGLKEILKETRDVFVDMLKFNNYGNDVGVILIVPNAYSTSSIEDIMLFYADDYFIYFFQSENDIDEFIMDDKYDNKNYKEDKKYRFKQSMYSHYSKVSNKNKLVVSDEINNKGSIILKKEPIETNHD